MVSKLKTFLSSHRKKTIFCWIVESLYEFMINLLSDIHAIYTAGITRCYEHIPLEGNDNLHDALGFVIRKGFMFHNGSSK